MVSCLSPSACVRLIFIIFLPLFLFHVNGACTVISSLSFLLSRDHHHNNQVIQVKQRARDKISVLLYPDVCMYVCMLLSV